jgi:hypothetical protein
MSRLASPSPTRAVFALLLRPMAITNYSHEYQLAR